MCARSSTHLLNLWSQVGLSSFPSSDAIKPPAQVWVYYVPNVDIVGHRVSRIVSGVSGVPPRRFELALHESEGVLNP